MKHKDVWNFEYKGIKCEIVHWGINEQFHPDGIWNSYITIVKKQLPRSFKKLLAKQSSYKIIRRVRKHWDYYKLENYFDFHGGITYYEVIRDEFSGEIIAIKAGCDYAHSGDEGRDYSLEYIKADLIKSVETFIKKFPNYLVWRNTDGKYVKYED